MENTTTDIFEQLRNGEIISPNNPQAHQLREASYATKKLLVQMNTQSKPVIRRTSCIA